MGGLNWSNQQTELFTKQFFLNDLNGLLAYFPDRSKSAVKSKIHRLGLVKGERRIFKNDELDTIKEKFPSMLTADLAKLLNCKANSVANKAHKLGLKKDKSFLTAMGIKNQENGKVSRFKKGNVSHNKGKKQKEFMSVEGLEKVKATQFKTGQRPPNYRPVGSERIDSKDGYILVKVREGKDSWELKHRVEWGKAHGAIKKGSRIMFKNRNRLDCSLGNLQEVTEKELMLSNTITQYPKDLQNLIKLNNKVKRNIKKFK